MDNHKKTARIAGAWYLAFILLCAFAMLFVDEKLSVAGDTAATIESFHANAGLFCFGLITYIAGYVCFIFSADALCRIFKSVNSRQTRLMMTFVLCGTAIALMCKVAQFVAVVSPAIKPQSDTAAMLLSIYKNGVNIAGVFWGLWLIPLGMLILQSRLIPKAIGVLLLTACAGHLMDCGIFFSASDILRESILPALYIIEIAGEFTLVIWLLIKGVKTQEQRNV